MSEDFRRAPCLVIYLRWNLIFKVEREIVYTHPEFCISYRKQHLSPSSSSSSWILYGYVLRSVPTNPKTVFVSPSSS